MLKPQLSRSSTCQTLVQCHNWTTFLSGSSSGIALPAGRTFPLMPKGRKLHNDTCLRGGSTTTTTVKAVAGTTTLKKVAGTANTTADVEIAKGTIYVRLTEGILSSFKFADVINGSILSENLQNVVIDLLGKPILVEVVSSELDTETGLEKETIKGYARKKERKDNMVIYEWEFNIPMNFGEIGAIWVENLRRTEMFITNIVIEPLNMSSINLSCDSFVASKFDKPEEKRIFFTNKAYLPSKMPEGLRRCREEELEKVRGDGAGERKFYDRIYDYDVYNDLGNPDSDPNQIRPVLGGKVNPYPRRCRTGRGRSKTDPKSESRNGSMYVPRDEAFSDFKNATFTLKTVSSVLPAVFPTLETLVVNSKLGFPYFTAIDTLYDDEATVQKLKSSDNWFKDAILTLLKFISTLGDNILLFDTPEIYDRDRFAWFRDEEFSRQTLAGINPMSIELVKEWPLKSKLDPKLYGPAESAITTEIVQKEIGGIITVEEAVEKKKLFVLDYHDLLMPYVKKVREIDDTTLYGSRALFFLTPEGVLRPLAIELVVPPSDDGETPQWKEVFIPLSGDSTACWLWRLAKAHVLAHDSGVHQLVSHWLRTHCCVEPYIIATHRQLSTAHPIYKLLHPHFRYTMAINALARQALINSEGIVEDSFSPRKYSIEISSVAYDKLWRFDHEALPANLINRGLAVEDPSAPHGLKLAIEDYPFANDGLLIWDAIKQWVTDYVNFYYPESKLVQDDTELQSWWEEIKTVGHGDKSGETWWPELNTQDDLIGILTTIIWVPSGHHAAVNFGQYPYAGYFPNRPTIARTKMPSEIQESEYWKNFIANPIGALLQCFPSQQQATTVMAVLDVLSNHSVDEEYIGGKIEPSWEEEGVIKAAFERYSRRVKEIEGIIDARNLDLSLKHRSGAGVVPYELLKPFSKPGVTGMGVPNSISI
ncbi:linoleate 13S-lipoxygenase 2-1, chloroplastic-like [Impatiens glandulifera]|uniref:linoleate 13S-lipoxygenase 2-1, chloroplastic-like n=1 Tax=Impatiens glandulifera TaxID=253017 RepID=UPI001FB0B9F0|nr:linoleate 13S-lipoxygenase 2-1, chloroplastic-like [Impatiens glandulifera]